MYDSWGVRKQPFVGKIRLQRCSGEKDQRRVAYSVVQTDLNICLQTVLIAKPLAEVLHFLTVHIVQTDLTELSRRLCVRLPITLRFPPKGLGRRTALGLRSIRGLRS